MGVRDWFSLPIALNTQKTRIYAPKGQYYAPVVDFNRCVVLHDGYFRKVNEVLYCKKLFRYFHIRSMSVRDRFSLPIALNTLKTRIYVPKGQYFAPVLDLNRCVVLDDGYFRKVNEVLYWKKLFRYFRICSMSVRD